MLPALAVDVHTGRVAKALDEVLGHVRLAQCNLIRFSAGRRHEARHEPGLGTLVDAGLEGKPDGDAGGDLEEDAPNRPHIKGMWCAVVFKVELDVIGAVLGTQELVNVGWDIPTTTVVSVCKTMDTLSIALFET